MSEITIQGDSQTLAHLQRLIDALHYAQEPLQATAQAALPVVRVYPPELPNQHYQRTGNLGRGWQYAAPQQNGAGASITVSNPVQYAPPVYGDSQQMPIFADRWLTLSQLVAQVRPIAEAEFAAWVAKVTQQ